ncbi:lipoate--protein ligase family protein [Facklamia sp. P12945]|uniref:lipoate--protein ligase family protein n=1 Tax=unclassified Facklamia TaxID=2622293 RepID=UPI003D182F14
MTDSNLLSILSQHKWLVFQEQENPLKDQRDVALAYQDSFLRYLLQKNDLQKKDKAYGIFHFYPIFKPSVFLGAKDKLLKNLPKGVSYLKEAGYQVSVRPHGGLGVVEDAGILNFAIVTDNRSINLSIDQAFSFSIAVIQATLNHYGLTVEAYEIADSYCPGKYDVVINQKKVGGIAQRRYKDAVTTAAYIGVNGNQFARGQLMKQFYSLSQSDQRFPTIEPRSMSTLSEILGQDLSLSDYQKHFINYLSQKTAIDQGNYKDPELISIYQPLFEKAYQRSQKIQPLT